MFQVRDSVMTRVSLSWSQDNEVTIAGLGMLNRLGLTKKDLQVTDNTSCLHRKYIRNTD